MAVHRNDNKQPWNMLPERLPSAEGLFIPRSLEKNLQACTFDVLCSTFSCWWKTLYLWRISIQFYSTVERMRGYIRISLHPFLFIGLYIPKFFKMQIKLEHQIDDVFSFDISLDITRRGVTSTVCRLRCGAVSVLFHMDMTMTMLDQCFWERLMFPSLQTRESSGQRSLLGTKQKQIWLVVQSTTLHCSVTTSQFCIDSGILQATGASC